MSYVHARDFPFCIKPDTGGTNNYPAGGTYLQAFRLFRNIKRFEAYVAVEASRVDDVAGVIYRTYIEPIFDPPPIVFTIVSDVESEAEMQCGRVFNASASGYGQCTYRITADGFPAGGGVLYYRAWIRMFHDPSNDNLRLYGGNYYPRMDAGFSLAWDADSPEILIEVANVNGVGSGVGVIDIGEGYYFHAPDSAGWAMSILQAEMVVPISEWWPYDPGDTASYPGKDGSGPIYNVNTGAELRDPFAIRKLPDGTFVNPLYTPP